MTLGEKLVFEAKQERKMNWPRVNGSGWSIANPNLRIVPPGGELHLMKLGAEAARRERR